MSAAGWVAEELAGLALGDERLNKRVQKVVADWSAQPGKSIPEFSGDWAATKGAYRLENESVSAEGVQAAAGATRQRIAQWQASSGEVDACIQDTTSIDDGVHEYARARAPPRLGGNRDFCGHDAGVSSSGVPLGVLQQHTYVREGRRSRRSSGTNRQVGAQAQAGQGRTGHQAGGGQGKRALVVGC
ncbi:MAG: transposase [Caldilineaceae bacterium]